MSLLIAATPAVASPSIPKPLQVRWRPFQATPGRALLLRHPFQQGAPASPSVPKPLRVVVGPCLRRGGIVLQPRLPRRPVGQVKPLLVVGLVRAVPSRPARSATAVYGTRSGAAIPPAVTDVRFNPLAASVGRLMGR